ncbi:MAG: protein-disulfide reductase DsbD domain-containing protein [Bryobacteraceae bacterium]
MRQFPTADGTMKFQVETAHLQVTASASDAVVRSGSRILLALDIELKPGMHVYAPGVEGGYIPIDWSITGSPEWTAHPLAAPASEKLHLPAINETVPVYQGKFRLTRELTVGVLRGPGRDLAISGTFRYQACDDKVCYTPRDVPLSWNVRLETLDTQRAPEELRRKTPAQGAR